MREVIITKTCDWHRAIDGDEGVPATEEATLIVDDVPRLLDLCIPCSEQVKALHEAGVVPDVVTPQPPTPKPGRISCPLCPTDTPSRGALGQHVTRAHEGWDIRKLVKEGLLAKA